VCVTTMSVLVYSPIYENSAALLNGQHWPFGSYCSGLHGS